MSRRVTFYTIGCRLNQAETAVLADRFKGAGYVPVKFGETTDLFVVNSCSVTEEAESDCRRVVRRVLRKSPNAFVAVTGCYAQTGIDTLRSMTGIDLILGSQYKMRLPDYLQSLPPSKVKRSDPEVLHTRKIDHENFSIEGSGDYSTTRANLKIQDGCQFMCSFCLIPFARGRERSRKLEDALREAEALAARGHKELVLTGVNIGQYEDMGSNLLDIIQRLERIDGIERIRISSIEPTTIPDSLIEYMATSEKLCRFLHVPLQSGDDGMLKAMNRRYSIRAYTGFIEKAASRIPHLSLGTDVLVGFPGEREREFANTKALVSDLPFAYLHVFSFSKRPGTAAARIQFPVSPATIKSRSKELAGISREKRLAFYQRFSGHTLFVLFEGQDASGLWTGFTDHYIRVGVDSTENLSNTLKPVVITGVMDGLAIGHLLDDQTMDNRQNRMALLHP